jgi:hypothetical protein
MSEPTAAVRVSLMDDGTVAVEAGGANNVTYLGLLEMAKTVIMETQKVKDQSPIIKPNGTTLPFKAS